ncbi:MAG TPA: N-acetylmuramic acid 6-phosphate etherase [Candidatus Acidoferrales bacterium]|nr:N-acetylmuramic acid 6-phosphate etherase [Candidatus Acidoferrales bacterium]
MTEGLPPTEAVDEATHGLDRMPTADLVAALIAAQRRAFDAAQEAAPQIARAADAISARLRSGGALHYVGAGTSGRLGVLDAAELPPTFGVSPSLARAHIAGGADAMTGAVEGAEDNAQGFDAEVRSKDAVIGISASGGASFVCASLDRAKAKGALTVAITSAPDSRLARHADVAIVTQTGAEPLAGSTRMLAGTAQKIVLSALSTAVMVRLGKVYDNLMIDVVATNEKLRKRALRLVRSLCDVDDARGRELLERAGGSVKRAVVMEKLGIDADAAQKVLSLNNESLRDVLESSPKP